MLTPEQVRELAQRERAEIPGAEVVEVDAVTREGKAHCTAAQPKASHLIGLNNAPLEELGALFREEVAGATQLDRLVCGAGILEFTPNGVVIRAVGPRLTARDLQDVLPFKAYAGPDLKRAADRLAD